MNWLETEHLQPEDTRYNDLLNFIDCCKLEGNSKRPINSKLRAIRNCIDYLKSLQTGHCPVSINPATNLNLKGIRQKLPSDIIDFKELENLYQSFETTTNREKRSKIVLAIWTVYKPRLKNFTH